MENVGLNIFLGVLSGVLTSGLLFVLYRIWLLIVRPWWENFLYKGTYIDGPWKSNTFQELDAKNRNDVSMHLDIQQNGYILSGDFSATTTLTVNGKKEKPFESFYRLKGHMVNNYVVLEYFPRSRRRTGLGTFVLEMKEGGQILAGEMSFIEVGHMEIASRSLHFHRDEGAEHSH